MSKKVQDISTLFLSLGILILLNVIGAFLFQRFDLTADNRYSLTEDTQELVSKLDDIVHFKVYLDGNLPPSFDRLRESTKEMLDELRAYQGQNVHYEFIDPSAAEKPKAIYRKLNKKGLRRMILRIKKKGARGEKIVYPGAVVRYQGKEVVMNLLDTRNSQPTPKTINKAIGNLEYRISHTIRKLKRGKKPKVAFIHGHGELGKRQVYDAVREMKSSYSVSRVKIDGQLDALKGKDAAIIAKPDSSFSDKDKFIIDQFIMNGGKVMWLVDPMQVRMDSLEKRSTIMAVPKDLRISEQIFSYGVRLNKNLILDQNCAPIGIVTDEFRGRPRIERHDWYYYPTASANKIQHPVSNNIDPVRFRFVSSLDTVSRKEVDHKVLLNSSDQVRVLPSPTRVSMNIISIDPAFDRSERSHVPMAVMLKGRFRSFFKGRIPPRIRKSKEIAFRTKSKKTRMLVAGDGDLIRNQVRKNGKVLPLGFEKYSKGRRNKVKYGNKEFILNSLEYLLTQSDDAVLRGGLTLRKLDKSKIEGDNRYYWQVVNTAVPIAIVIVFGVLRHDFRVRRYGASF
ncbi:MAG: gliding motility-associated ABC transporter substrate-binding protein GldG [Flavobacteriales bacterium]